MAVAFRAAGSPLDGVDGVTLGLPAGAAAGDILIAVFNGDQVAGVSATGWTNFLEADGNIAEQLSLLWRRSDGADPLTFDFSGSEKVGAILAFSGCAASGDPIGVTGAPLKATASATITATGITPPSNNNGVVFVGIAQDAVALRTCSGYSGASPALTEALDGGAVVGSLSVNASIAVAFGAQGTAAATGSRTATLSGTPVENQGVMFSLLPFVASTGPTARGFRRPVPQIK